MINCLTFVCPAKKKQQIKIFNSQKQTIYFQSWRWEEADIVYSTFLLFQQFVLAQQWAAVVRNKPCRCFHVFLSLRQKVFLSLKSVGSITMEARSRPGKETWKCRNYNKINTHRKSKLLKRQKSEFSILTFICFIKHPTKIMK